MYNLKDKAVFVTGASGDIGLACAEAFVKEGANLILHSFKNSNVIEKFAKKYPESDIFHINCNATDENQIKNQFDLLLTQKPNLKVDVLINNAGDLLDRKSLSELDWSFVQKTIDVNVKSAFLFTRYCLPFFAHDSSIIFISSLTARCGKGDRSSAYGLAKGALLSWSKCLANELGNKSIRVNCITPGFIKGQFHDKYTKKSVELEHAKRNPLGRVGIPADVAQAALFFASVSDGYISGTTLDVCGADYMN